MTRTYTIHISRKNAKRHAIPSRHYIMTRIQKKGCIILEKWILKESICRRVRLKYGVAIAKVRKNEFRFF